MKESHVVAVEAEPNELNMNPIVVGLTMFNAAQAGGEIPQYLLISVRDAEGEIVGGLVGASYLGWLQVHAVWLPEELRGSRYGSTLMHEAEQEAVRRGCPRVFLETLSFQALPFYEKLGYSVFSRLPDFPPGGARYALTKSLSAPSESSDPPA